MADRRARKDGVQSARALLLAGIRRAQERGTVDWPIDDALLAAASEYLTELNGSERSRGTMAMNTMTRRFHEGDRYRSAVLECAVKERLVDVDHPSLPDISEVVFPVDVPAPGNDLGEYISLSVDKASGNASHTHLLWEALNRSSTDERARDAVRDVWTRRNQEAATAVRERAPETSVRDAEFLTTAVLIATQGGALVEAMDVVSPQQRRESVADVAGVLVEAALMMRMKESASGPRARVTGNKYDSHQPLNNNSNYQTAV